MYMHGISRIPFPISSCKMKHPVWALFHWANGWIKVHIMFHNRKQYNLHMQVKKNLKSDIHISCQYFLNPRLTLLLLKINNRPSTLQHAYCSQTEWNFDFDHQTFHECDNNRWRVGAFVVLLVSSVLLLLSPSKHHIITENCIILQLYIEISIWHLLSETIMASYVKR